MKTGYAVSQTVWIGSTQYTNDAPGGGWQAQHGLPAAAVPSFVWDYFQPLSNVRLVGTENVDGVATTLLAGFGSRQATAIWFTFWIDAHGLVRQVEMHAPGHFMTDRFSGFDSPQNIAAPLPAG